MKRMAGKWIRACAVIVSLASWAVPGASAATNEWYPGGSGFTGWPTNWVSMPSLNDPKGDVTLDRLDFVGDDLNPGAFWSANSNYFFIRMRVAVSNVTASTFRDCHWIYIDRLDYTNGAAAPGMPDYALAWDTKSNDTSKHGLELMTGTNLTATTYWSQMSLSDIDNSSSSKVSPPDFALTGDGYLRTIDMRPTTNFGYTTYIDFAVSWAFISSNTMLGTNQQWRLQFGSRNDSTDHNFPQDDIAGGFSPSSVVTSSYSAVIASRPLSSSIDFSVWAAAGGVVVDLWTANEAGNGAIVIYAWLNGAWAEIGRVPSDRVVGEGSNHYVVDVGGLTVGGTYLFKVVDESGREHLLPEPVEVKTIRMSAVRLETGAAHLVFNTEANRRYVVMGSGDLVHWSTEDVSTLTGAGWSAYASAPFTAQGASTEAKVLAGKGAAFFKIVRVD